MGGPIPGSAGRMLGSFGRKHRSRSQALGREVNGQAMRGKGSVDGSQALPALEDLFAQQLEALQQCWLDLNTPEPEIDAAASRLKDTRARIADIHRMRLRSSAAPAFGRNASASSFGRPASASSAADREIVVARVLNIVGKMCEDAGGEVKVNDVTSSPMLLEMKKGFITSIAKLLRQHPETFEIYDATNEATGKPTQMILLVGPVPDPPEDVELAQQQLLAEIGSVLEENTYEMALEDLTQHPRIRELRKNSRGMVAKVGIFIKRHPELFEMSTVPPPVEGKQPLVMVRLIGQVPSVKREKWFRPLDAKSALEVPMAKHQKLGHGIESAAALEEQRDRLLGHIAQMLAAAGGWLTLRDVAANTEVRSLKTGAVSNLRKFLASRPEVVALEEEVIQDNKPPECLVRLVTG